MRTKAYPCRFPGCEWTARAAAPRGRHESQSHGMKKGVVTLASLDKIGVQVLPPKADMFNELFNAATAGDPPTPNGHMSPADHVRAALADTRAEWAAVAARCHALETALLALDPDVLF